MENNLALWLIAWIAALAAIFVLQWRRGPTGVGLVIGFALNLWLIHWVAAALYILPWYGNFNTDDVLGGFKQSTYAVFAFVIGSTLIAPLLMRALRFPPGRIIQRDPDPRLSRAFIWAGIICYFVLMPLLGGIPSVTALLSSGWNLVIVGLILKCWDAWRRGNRRSFLRWLLTTACLPFITVITQGFLGYGTAAMLAVLVFVANFYRPRWKLVLAGVVLGFLGLTLYVTYMRDRTSIRASVWGGQSYESRLDQLYNTFTDFELFDPFDNSHLQRIDERLNQSVLIGASIRYIDAGRQDFAAGQTIMDAAMAVVPRALWWDKPMTAGSGNLVSTYTGIEFAEATSVGVGQVLEFYINFGTAGVIGGFIVLGVLVAFFDRAAAVRLVEGDWQAFAFWFLPGLGFMQVGGQLVEVTMSTTSAMVLALIIKRHVLPRMRGRRLGPAVGKLRSFESPARQ